MNSVRTQSIHADGRGRACPFRKVATEHGPVGRSDGAQLGTPTIAVIAAAMRLPGTAQD